MSGEKVFNSLDSFVDGVKSLDVTKLAFSEVYERRAEQVEPEVLDVIVMKRVNLLAYKDSTIYKCTLSDSDHDAVYDQLVSQGFEVKRINNNIT